MTNPALHPIPAPQRDSVRSALAAAFGSTPIGAIVPITGGDSGALPFRVQAGGRSVLLRLEGPASPLRNPHQYVSMRIAADAGIAPRIYHIDEEARTDGSRPAFRLKQPSGTTRVRQGTSNAG